MGMDVYGKAPRSKAGKYFRNNVWWWRPLASMIEELCPDEAAPCEHWHSNDGDGLDDEQATALANKLDSLIQTGAAQAWIEAHEGQRKSAPRERCELCNGTGVRRDAFGLEMKQPERVCEGVYHDASGEHPHPRAGQAGWCNGCNGIGTREAWVVYYPASVENVREFSAFCRDSGGFEIC